MDGLRAGIKYQWAIFRARPTDVGILVGIPFTTAVLLSIVRFAHRADLAGDALLAPALFSLWSVALTFGTHVNMDRFMGVLGLVLASPASFVGYLWGRVTATVFIGVIGFCEAWLVGVVFFGARPEIRHPGWLVLCLVASTVATIPATALIATVVANDNQGGMTASYLNYPIYVLAGIFTPVALLPGWLHPISRALYLSWSADLARSCLTDKTLIAPGQRIGIIFGLGVLTGLICQILLARTANWLRSSKRPTI